MSGETSSPDSVGFSLEVEEMRERVARARHGDDDYPTDVLLEELETTTEELRVADEEARAQHQEVARLLEDRQLLSSRHERMLSMLPIPVLTTDQTGRIRSLNAAGAALLGVRVHHLLRKPVFTFVAETDRRELRSALSETLREGSARRHHLRLVLRDHEVPVTAYLARSPQPSDDVTWLLLGASHVAHEARLHEGGPLPDALLSLFALSGRGCELHDIAQHSANVVAQTVGAEAEVSLLFGSPAAPDAVASTSQGAQMLDRWQLESGTGPGALAFESRETVASADVAHDPRWTAPDPDPMVAPLTSAVAAPLVQGDQARGVLAVYLRRGGQPSEATVETVEILAAAITSVLQELGLRTHIESLAVDMREALASRSTIEQAKGIVMAAKHCTADEAFGHLVMLSNTGHVKLRDVAAQVVQSAGG